MVRVWRKNDQREQTANCRAAGGRRPDRRERRDGACCGPAPLVREQEGTELPTVHDNARVGIKRVWSHARRPNGGLKMRAQRRKSRIYWRERGGTTRAYADLRDYADVGGGREALVAEGEKLATADETTAQVLLARRLEQLDGTRRGRALHGETRQVTLADFAQSHLVAKAESLKFTEHWLEVTEKCLDRAASSSARLVTWDPSRSPTCAAGPITSWLL